MSTLVGVTIDCTICREYHKLDVADLKWKLHADEDSFCCAGDFSADILLKFKCPKNPESWREIKLGEYY